MSALHGAGRVLLFDPRRCTGCRSCEVACSFKHYSVCDYTKSHIRHFFDPPTGNFETAHCQHCEDPLCEAACPTEAIRKDLTTGIVKINPLKCIGCQACNFACPLSIPRFDAERRVSAKCDLCDGDPECVKFCSTRALRYMSRDEARRLMMDVYSRLVATR